MSVPDLGLSIEIETIDGFRERLALDEALASKRAVDGEISNRLDEGFGSARFPLARDVNQDWPDLNLLDTWRVLDADGNVAWEGRHVGKPATVRPRPGFDVEATGWAAAWEDRTFVDILADSGTEGWGGPSIDLRLAFAAQNYSLGVDFTASAEAGRLVFDGSEDRSIPNNSRAILEYVAPDGVEIARWSYYARRMNVGSNYVTPALRSNDDDSVDLPSWDTTTVTFDAQTIDSLPEPARYLVLGLIKTGGASSPADPAKLIYSALCVYGNHDLELIDSDAGGPPGFRVSDALAYLLRYCPALVAGEIEPTDWSVPQGAWKQGATFATALNELNDTQLWHPAVWEGRRFDYGPHDLSDEAVDWEIRTDDPGVALNLQGDSVADLRNGLCVEYEDIADGPRRLTPETHPDELADPNPDNPANRAGIPMWGAEPLRLDYPTVEEQALRVGQVALAELQRPRSPGAITLRTGMVRDRGGVWQPGTRVRAGQTLIISDHPNPSPRLITEARVNFRTKALDITVERPSRRIENLLATRISRRRAARGLG